MNNIESTIWLLAHSSNPEDRREWAVLYWRSQGLKHEEIAEKWGYSIKWVQRYTTRANKRFEVPQHLNNLEKLQYLEQNVFPLMRKFIANEPDSIRELPPPPTELEQDIHINEDSVEEQKGDKVISVDEKNNNENPKDPPIIEILPPKQLPPPKDRWRTFRRVFFTIVSLVIISIVGYFAYNLGRGATPVPEIIVITATPIPATDTPVATPTPIFTQTSLPTFTFTAEPSFTPAPTATQKGYYDQGEGVLLAEGVYAYLNEEFQGPGNICWKPNNGFALIIIVENNSDNDYDVRFDATGFHAKDNLGNEYKLRGSGIFYCEDKFGIIEGQIRDGSSNNIGMQFEGIIPLEAEYVDITVDFISGIGPIIFRKYIY